VTERDNVRTAMARLVRQSLEMGDAEWFLDRMDRRTALELLGSGASGGRRRQPGGSAGAS
jgi:hypothetical protein